VWSLAWCGQGDAARAAATLAAAAHTSDGGITVLVATG